MTTLCPSCRTEMHKLCVDGKPSGSLELDICFSCQGIWFDQYESVRITPGSIIELFKLIHAHRDDPRLSLRETLQCPRCDERLLHGLDLAKGGRFNYYRCLAQHGRFTAFSQFMIEKGFVRQLSVAEIDQLKPSLQVIRCASCGAPVDIRTESACSHCRSPIAVLDAEAVQQALAGYHQAEIRRTAPDPDARADAILAAERARSHYQRVRTQESEIELGDLIASGIDLVCNLLAD